MYNTYGMVYQRRIIITIYNNFNLQNNFPAISQKKFVIFSYNFQQNSPYFAIVFSIIIPQDGCRDGRVLM